VVTNSGISDAYVKICLLSGGALNYYDDASRGDVAIVVRIMNTDGAGQGVY
jgi:hypothetical protein